MESRIWVPFGGILALAAPAAAFVAGFQGLTDLIPKEAATAWAFAAGLLGVLALWARKQSDTEGLSERVRGTRLMGLGTKLRDVLADYSSYRDALAMGTPVGNFTDEQTLFEWLCTQRDALEETRNSLGKFVFKL